MVKFVVP